MNIKDLNKDFLPRELVLKLFTEIPKEKINQRINLVANYAETIKGSMETEAFEVRLHDQFGFIYWEAGSYTKAIEHYTLAIKILRPVDYPFLYFHIVCLLIRCNRLLDKYSDSLNWAEEAFENIEHADSPFQVLTVLNEYVTFIESANISFNPIYTKIAKAVFIKLGFTFKFLDPIETIKLMKKKNLNWNKKLNQIKRESRGKSSSENKKAYLEYKDSVEIKWYADYAATKIQELENVG